MYSVSKIKQLFENDNIKIKQGTIEEFRSKLSEFHLISNNQQLSDEHLNTLKKIVSEKTDNVTWQFLMNKHIYLDYADMIHTDFVWKPKIIVKHLLHSIENESYKVSCLDLFNNEEDIHIFCCIIDNFVEMGKTYSPYDKSFGTDGNSSLCFKIETSENEVYYLIGKLNKYTFKEEVHLFYNKSPQFNPMVCKYISGGDYEHPKLSYFDQLVKTCRELVYN